MLINITTTLSYNNGITILKESWKTYLEIIATQVTKFRFKHYVTVIHRSTLSKIE